MIFFTLEKIIMKLEMFTEEIKKEKHCEILSIQVKFNDILIFARSLENRKIKK